jgi:hypothetical protein
LIFFKVTQISLKIVVIKKKTSGEHGLMNSRRQKMFNELRQC